MLNYYPKVLLWPRLINFPMHRLYLSPIFSFLSTTTLPHPTHPRNHSVPLYHLSFHSSSPKSTLHHLLGDDLSSSGTFEAQSPPRLTCRGCRCCAIVFAIFAAAAVAAAPKSYCIIQTGDKFRLLAPPHPSPQKPARLRRRRWPGSTSSPFRRARAATAAAVARSIQHLRALFRLVAV